MLLKTDAAQRERVIARLAGPHPCAEPAILGWRCNSATPATATWLRALRP